MLLISGSWSYRTLLVVLNINRYNIMIWNRISCNISVLESVSKRTKWCCVQASRYKSDYAWIFSAFRWAFERWWLSRVSTTFVTARLVWYLPCSPSISIDAHGTFFSRNKMLTCCANEGEFSIWILASMHKTGFQPPSN